MEKTLSIIASIFTICVGAFVIYDFLKSSENKNLPARQNNRSDKRNSFQKLGNCGCQNHIVVPYTEEQLQKIIYLKSN